MGAPLASLEPWESKPHKGFLDGFYSDVQRVSVGAYTTKNVTIPLNETNLERLVEDAQFHHRQVDYNEQWVPAMYSNLT